MPWSGKFADYTHVVALNPSKCTMSLKPTKNKKGLFGLSVLGSCRNITFNMVASMVEEEFSLEIYFLFNHRLA